MVSRDNHYAYILPILLTIGLATVVGGLTDLYFFHTSSAHEGFWHSLTLHEQFVHIFITLLAACLLTIFSINRRLKKNLEILDNTFDNTDPICITDINKSIIMANRSYWQTFGDARPTKPALKCYEHRPGDQCHTDRCPLNKMTQGDMTYNCEAVKRVNGHSVYFLITSKPIFKKDKLIAITEAFHDITAQKKLEFEKEALIADLKESMNKVKVLSGLLPICASCKKIRDDKGYWNQIETYLLDHSEAEFSHSLCPQCITDLYPDLDLEEETGT